MDRPPALEPWYVSGLIDGEGSFTFHRNGRRLVVVFGLRRPAGDRRLLEAIRGFFGGIGRLYDTPGSGAGSGGVYYRVARTADLLRIVDHLDRFPLRSERLEAYAIWREMVLTRVAYHGSAAPVQLERLAERLTAR